MSKNVGKRKKRCETIAPSTRMVFVVDEKKSDGEEEEIGHPFMISYDGIWKMFSFVIRMMLITRHFFFTPPA